MKIYETIWKGYMKIYENIWIYIKYDIYIYVKTYELYMIIYMKIYEKYMKTKKCMKMWKIWK